MSAIDSQQARLCRIAWTVPIAGMLLLGGCSVADSSAQAPVSAQPTQGPRSSLSPTPSGPSAPANTPSGPAAPVPVAPVSTLPPVPRGAAAAFGTGVSAQVTAVEPITAVATAPGDIAGPALAISLTLTNGSNDAVDTEYITVTANDATGAPASPVTGDQAHPFSGRIPPGASQNATYAFRIPADTATGALIVVSYRAGVPVATLTL